MSVQGCPWCSSTGGIASCPDHNPQRYTLTSWPPPEQAAILLRDTPEDRERLIAVLHKRNHPPFCACSGDYHRRFEIDVDAILTALRGRDV